MSTYVDPEKTVLELAEAARRLEELEKASPEAAEAKKLTEKKQELLKKLEEHYEWNRIRYYYPMPVYPTYIPIWPTYPTYPYPTWQYNGTLTLTCNAVTASTTTVPSLMGWNLNNSATTPTPLDLKGEEEGGSTDG